MSAPSISPPVLSFPPCRFSSDCDKVAPHCGQNRAAVRTLAPQIKHRLEISGETIDFHFN